MSTYRKLMTFGCAAVLALGLAACGGGGSSTSDAPPPVVEPEPTAAQAGMAAIAAATTAEAAQAAYDAVDQDAISGTERAALEMALANRLTAIETVGRIATQKMALMDAAGMIDTSDLSTQALVDAARTAIAGLRQAIADAVDVDDTSMYQTMLDNAVDAVDMAQGGIDTATRRTNQMAALSGASDDLQAALAALSGATPTQALLDAANNALTALNTALTGGADLTDTEKAPYQHEADNAAAPIQMAQKAFDDAEDEAEKMRIAEMAVTAMRLYAGINAPSATAAAAYGTGDNAADIAVTIGTDAAVNLSEDEDATVADRDGWTGMRFAAEPEGDVGTYEAVVYSHIGDPTVTEGDAFNMAYTLSTDAPTMGELTALLAASGEAGVGRVASPSFDQDAGEKTFELGSNMVRVMLSGSYHGVSGMYYCTPADGDMCGATVADMGFILGGGTWSFKPTNPESKLMDTSAPDEEYASYGWWLHKSEDGDTFTASAFAIYRGTAPTVEIAELRGSAMYTGGAAGKYSLRGDTGGTNDAGHFTADATLEATFAADHTISGTISNFMGADGMARDWSVKLNETDISDAGVIDGLGGDANDEQVGTVWTIGETAGGTTGQWSGNLHEEGDDGVPAIATGTFHSTYGHGGNDGVMVGAFGANKE